MRHPESEYNAKGLWAGWQDPALTARGWQQTEEAAQAWAGWKPRRIVSSDLERAAAAAARIAEVSGAVHTVDPELRERSAGSWQGRLLSELKDDPAYLEWSASPRTCPPEGEPYDMFARRIRRRLSDILKDDVRTLVVAHGGVLDMLGEELAVEGSRGWSPRALLDAISVEGAGKARLWSISGEAEIRSGLEVEEAPACHTCELSRGARDEDVVWRSALTLINHTSDEDREGWFVLSPLRHVTAPRLLTYAEQDEMAELTRAVDSILVEMFGARRNMFASLGWYTPDHMHVHMVPTFGATVSYGSLNFDGAYIPWPGSRQEASKLMRESLETHPSLGRFRV